MTKPTMTSPTATPRKESQGTCACCGNTSKTIWGDLSDDQGTHAVYYVQWAVDSPDHFPNIDLIIRPWGEGTNADHRVLACLRFRPTPDGGSFMVIDAGDRRRGGQPLFTRSLRGRKSSELRWHHRCFNWWTQSGSPTLASRK